MNVVDDARWSSALGEDIRSHVVVPDGPGPFPTVYLLHGRGGTRDDWLRVMPRLASLPPMLVVMPDAPWSDRGSWYVDSAFTGEPPGRPVRTALTQDLVAHVDATYPTSPDREHRFVGGCSMGGAGALELLLDRADLFSGGLVLGPAVYEPQPPEESNTRTYGAFGSGGTRFVEDVYAAHTAAALFRRHDPAFPVRLSLAVGDRDELCRPTERVHEYSSRAPGVDARLRVLTGGHDWDLWEEAFVDGLPYVLGVPEETSR